MHADKNTGRLPGVSAHAYLKANGAKALPAVQALQKKEAVQREIIRGADTEQNTINLTDTLLHYTDFGTTPVSLNLIEFPGGNPDNAIVAPTFLARQAGENDVAVSISTEPINIVSSRVVLPTAPPWVAQSTLNNLAVRIQGTGASFDISDEFIGDNGAAAAMLEVCGLPSDGAFAALVRTHELHHVADINTAIDHRLRPWDQAIHTAMEQGTEIHGASEPAAIANFYAALGGTPQEIGTAFRDRLRVMGVAYHQLAEGGAPVIENVTTHATMGGGYLVRVYYEHPGG